ncbi:TetR/AcrR family transcriptional regulator [Nonomuraea ferruginea]
MPRIAEVRTPAEPSSPEQRARHLRILGAAARIGADRGLERVQMHEVAKAAGGRHRHPLPLLPVQDPPVHRGAGRADRPVQREPPPPGARRLPRGRGRRRARPGQPPAPAASPRWPPRCSSRPAPPTRPWSPTPRASRTPPATSSCGRWPSSEPTPMDVTLVRLLVQCWYGVLQSGLNGRLPIPQMESDLRIACRLLLAGRSNA